ncbi:MAG: leucine-rich repeat domain-containing protein, partial [Treponema sp.]|nr:leucine-rich repeat domain-containing protein [Treponema sp.]
MGFDNVVTIENGTDMVGITNTIYSLTSDTTLKFKGGINAITLTTIAAAIGTNDSVKIALDFSETTGITEWTNKLAGQKTLYAISLPNTVTNIADNAFYECTNLRAITIPDSLTINFSVDAEYINFAGTFVNWLKSSFELASDQILFINGLSLKGIVEIPATVTSIKNKAFYRCNMVESVVIPESVTKIGDSAFSGCSSLTSVTIPDSVTSIGSNAFNGCSNLTDIAIPNSITYIGDKAFYNCTNLKELFFEDGNIELQLNGEVNVGVGWDYSGIFYNCPLEKLHLGRPLSYYEIPNWYARYAPFYEKTTLTSVEISTNITEIGEYMFSYCSGLSNVVIPSSVTSIGQSAFTGCAGLTSIIIPDSVIEIGDSAFSGCSSLTSITIPGNITSIEGGTFRGCTSLKEVTIADGNTLLEISTGYSAGSWYSLFTDCPLETVYLGRNLYFSNFSNSATASPFCNKYELVSVNISNNVALIWENLFYGCTGLRSITIPESMNHIYESAFYNCTGLIIVNYRGTESQWQGITIDLNNESLTNATIVYNYTGD